MKRPLSIWRLIAVVMVLATAGCGRTELTPDDPQAGRIEFVLNITQSESNFYDSFELCWEGILDTAQGVTPGDDDTVSTFQNIPAHQTIMNSPLSEELRAGTWRIHARLTGIKAAARTVVLEFNDCVNSGTPGVRPTVFAGTTTRVLLLAGFSTCEWSVPGSASTPNMGEAVVQPCSPAVSRLAVPRRLG